MRQIVGDMLAEGKTLEQVQAAKPTAAYDEQYGEAVNFVDRVYASLSKELAR